MWIRTNAGALLNLTRCTELRTEPGSGDGFRIVAVDTLSESGRIEVVADELTEEVADRLMWELAARALHAAEIKGEEIKLRT